MEPKSRLLLVDDIYSNLDALEAAIDSYLGKRFDYVRSFSGHDALAKIENENFDLLITDLLMPFGDGYFLVEELRRKHNDIPIIIWTGIEEIDFKRLHASEVEFVIQRREPIEKLMGRIDLIIKSKSAPHL